MMRFLLKHESFRDNLTYEFIQIKIINDIRIYIKMYTKN